jgi:hypothetical protein
MPSTKGVTQYKYVVVDLWLILLCDVVVEFECFTFGFSIFSKSGAVCYTSFSTNIYAINFIYCVLLCVVASEMVSLKELDLRASKKQVCKITPELVASLKEQFCKVRGGVIKKAKGGGKKKAAAAAP